MAPCATVSPSNAAQPRSAPPAYGRRACRLIRCRRRRRHRQGECSCSTRRSCRRVQPRERARAACGPEPLRSRPVGAMRGHFRCSSTRVCVCHKISDFRARSSNACPCAGRPRPHGSRIGHAVCVRSPDPWSREFLKCARSARRCALRRLGATTLVGCRVLYCCRASGAAWDRA